MRGYQGRVVGGDQCSVGDWYGQCNKHGKCIIGKDRGKSGELLNCECGGDLVYRNCHPMCGACNSKGPCAEACVKGCGCPRDNDIVTIKVKCLHSHLIAFLGFKKIIKYFFGDFHYIYMISISSFIEPWNGL